MLGFTTTRPDSAGLVVQPLVQSVLKALRSVVLQSNEYSRIDILSGVAAIKYDLVKFGRFLVNCAEFAQFRCTSCPFIEISYSLLRKKEHPYVSGFQITALENVSSARKLLSCQDVALFYR